MAKTLLAVDDSVTMRKVLEITFSGEDFKVVTADSSQGALGKLTDVPHVCVIDTSLNGEDGYSLAKELRRRNPAASIIMLASRYAPYDQMRGREAGADDWADKPFDTQQLIDKVRKVMLAKESGAGAPAAHAPAHAPAVAHAPAHAPAVHAHAPAAHAHAPAAHAQPHAPAPARPAPPAAPRPVSSPAIGRGTQPSISTSVPQRTGTLMFGENPIATGARPAGHAPAAAPAPSPAAPPVAAVSGAVNGALSGKLGELGLTREQTEAVLALSREVVERVVWEVVPQLAETIIKEEIARLTR